MSPNQPNAANPAITLVCYAEHQWREVAGGMARPVCIRASAAPRHSGRMLGIGVARMALRISIITLLIMGILSSLFGCSERGATRPAKQEFAELSREGIARLEQQRVIVAGVVKQRYGVTALTKTREDLPTLQRLLDDRVFSKTQTYELQCLGVAFGDVLASELPLRWMMVTDAFGTDPSLRCKDSSIQINALTMISKRVEEDRETNLADLMEGVRYSLKKMVESGNYK